MCNRPINHLDISVMKGEAYEVKSFSLVGGIRSGMTMYPTEHYLKKKNNERIKRFKRN